MAALHLVGDYGALRNQLIGKELELTNLEERRQELDSLKLANKSRIPGWRVN